MIVAGCAETVDPCQRCNVRSIETFQRIPLRLGIGTG
jgi:hypothetical protein